MKTMAQIAREAGLSRFTVSKILSGDPSVRRENRERVLRLCDQYGFVPNSNAVNLVSGGSRVIAMIVPYITDGFYAELIEMVEKYAVSCNMRLTYQSSYNNADVEAEIIRTCMGLKVAAMLIIPAVINANLRMHRLAAANFPVVYLDRPLSDNCCSVLNDNRESMKIMTSHLFAHAPEVAYLDSFYRDSNPTALERRRGYLEAVIEHHAREFFLPPCQSCEQQDNERYGFDHMTSFLRHNSRPPRAVCCVTDAVALGVMRALRDHGFAAGRDTLIGGHDNLHFGAYTLPTLSSMAQPKEEMAQAAINMALMHRENPELPLERRIFHSRLIVRDSSISPDDETKK